MCQNLYFHVLENEHPATYFAIEQEGSTPVMPNMWLDSHSIGMTEAHKNPMWPDEGIFFFFARCCTLWWTYKKLLKMAIEIVDFPIKNGDFPLLC